MNEKHNGETVTFKMNVESVHLNNALSRQCSEAIGIKEVKATERINNKEEYHQPGDVEVSYVKNDNQKKIIANKDTNQTAIENLIPNTGTVEENIRRSNGSIRLKFWVI